MPLPVWCRYERLQLLGHCIRHPDRPEGWIIQEGQSPSKHYPEDPNLEKKSVWQIRLKRLTEVMREAEQVRQNAAGKVDLELIKDKKVWAVVLRGYVKTMRKMTGELRRHSSA